MGFCEFFWVIGIIALIIEYYLFTHLYHEVGSFSTGYHLEKINFRVLHLLLLVILNLIPIINAIGLICCVLIPVMEDDIYFKLVPPDEEKEDKVSKLDKLLNKKL